MDSRALIWKGLMHKVPSGSEGFLQFTDGKD